MLVIWDQSEIMDLKESKDHKVIVEYKDQLEMMETLDQLAL